MRCGWIGAVLLTASVAARALAAAPASSPAPPPLASDSTASTAAPVAPPAVPPQPPRRRRASAPSTPSPITDHFAISGIYLWGTVSTTGQVNASTILVGTPFSAEQQLGLSSSAHLPLVELQFRLAQRNQLRFDFLELSRQGTATVTEPIQYGDQLFQTGQVLNSDLDWRETDFTYTYSVIRNDRFELGVGPALHLIQVYASAAVPNSSAREVYSAAGPFATVAVQASVRLDRHWSLNARGQYLRLNIDQSSGEMGIYHADLQYRWLTNVSFGAGYESRRVQVDIHNANPSGTVHMNITGPELFARMSW